MTPTAWTMEGKAGPGRDLDRVEGLLPPQAPILRAIDCGVRFGLRRGREDRSPIPPAPACR
jgi:hypothetical protein